MSWVEYNVVLSSRKGNQPTTLTSSPTGPWRHPEAHAAQARAAPLRHLHRLHWDEPHQAVGLRRWCRLEAERRHMCSRSTEPPHYFQSRLFPHVSVMRMQVHARSFQSEQSCTFFLTKSLSMLPTTSNEKKFWFSVPIHSGQKKLTTRPTCWRDRRSKKSLPSNLQSLSSVGSKSTSFPVEQSKIKASWPLPKPPSLGTSELLWPQWQARPQKMKLLVTTEHLNIIKASCVVAYHRIRFYWNGSFDFDLFE